MPEPGDVWRKVLVDGDQQLRFVHRVFRHLPSAPRCKLCHNPFKGLGGAIVGVAGFKPSRKNPNLCARCCEGLPPGGLEVEVAVLFADVRGSTALCERVGAEAFAALLNNFYRTATKVLIRHDAIIDKLIGDEVMALFIPGIAGAGYRKEAASAAVELVHALHDTHDLPVGAAVTAGMAYVGNVGGDGIVDFTALGDPVNAAARLQAHARAHEVVLANDLYREISDHYPNARFESLEIRGQESALDVHILSTL